MTKLFKMFVLSVIQDQLKNSKSKQFIASMADCYRLENLIEMSSENCLKYPKCFNKRKAFFSEVPEKKLIKCLSGCKKTAKKV